MRIIHAPDHAEHFATIASTARSTLDWRSGQA